MENKNKLKIWTYSVSIKPAFSYRNAYYAKSYKSAALCLCLAVEQLIDNKTELETKVNG
jgi:hypothetical protein